MTFAIASMIMYCFMATIVAGLIFYAGRIYEMMRWVKERKEMRNKSLLNPNELKEYLAIEQEEKVTRLIEEITRYLKDTQDINSLNENKSFQLLIETCRADKPTLELVLDEFSSIGWDVKCIGIEKDGNCENQAECYVLESSIKPDITNEKV